jgi:outer membrane protein assembly factor BamB
MRTRLLIKASLVFFLVILVTAVSLHAEDWPNWRGPRQNGTSAESVVPLHWEWTEGDEDADGTSRNVVWRTELPEFGNGTPIFWEEAIFLTAQNEDGKLLLMRLERESGELVWTREVGEGDIPRNDDVDGRGRQKFHNEQNLASSSAVTDGQVVAVHFGNGDTAVYGFDGNRLWKRNMQEEHAPYSIWWGHANSPVLCEDLVILVSMQDSCEDLQATPVESYVAAYDKTTGALRWKTSRMTDADAEHCDSYTTPLLRYVGGRMELILMGGEVLDAYNPATGERLWFLENVNGNRVITGPAIVGDRIYLTHGMRGPTIGLQIPANSSGELDWDDVLLWVAEGNTPDSPCPAVDDGLVYTVSDRGIAKCIDAETGEPYWEERLQGAHRSSPLVVADRVYFLNMEGNATVVKAGPEFELLAENKIDDRTLATPIASEGRLYIRGWKSLICIEE